MVAELGDSTDVSPDVIERPVPQGRIQQGIVEETVDVSVPQLLEHLVEERQLLSAAYKSLADSRRAVRRVINRVKQKERTKGNEQEATHAKGNAVNLEIELQMVCDGILALMDESLILSASTGEPRDFRHEIIKRVEEIPQIKVPVSQSFIQTEEQSYPVPQVLTQEVMVPMVQLYPECLNVPYVNPIMQAVEKTLEVPQVQYTDRIVGVPVVTQRRIPAHGTVEVYKIVSQDRIQQRTAEQITDTPVPQVAEEVIEMFNMFSQDRVQQRMVAQTTETPSKSLDEEIMEHAIEETIDIPVPHVTEKTIEDVKIIPRERVQNYTVEQIIDVPVMKQGRVPTTQTVQKTVEESRVQFPDRVVDVPVLTQRHVPIKVPQIQLIDKAMDMPVIVQRQVPIVRKVQKTAEIPKTQFIDKVVDVPVHMQRQFPAVQVAQKSVKELRSTFEVGHTSEVHARNQPDKNRRRKKQGFEATQYPRDVQERADLTNQRQVPAIRNAQKTVEVPRVQYIDKVADIPVDERRRGSTIPAAQHDLQHIDEAVHVPALAQSEVPNIQDDDEDWLE